MNAALALAVLTTSASASACVIDDRMITATPDPIALGGFESGSLAADDPRFGNWSPYSYGMDQVSLRATLAHIECNSIGCLSLDWQLADATDGAPSQAGVGERAAAVAPVDLGAHSKLVFSHFFGHQGQCAAPSRLTAIIVCDGLQSARQASVDLATGWTTRAIETATLAEASPARGVPTADCLRAVSAVQFQIDVALTDGACASGNLFLDGVVIR